MSTSGQPRKAWSRIKWGTRPHKGQVNCLPDAFNSLFLFLFDCHADSIMMKVHLLSLLFSLALCPSASVAAAIGSSVTDSVLDRAFSDCRNDLSCTFAEIEAMSMSTRLDYIRTMQSDFFRPLNAGNQFRAIEGVITFFIQNDLGKPNSWASYVDASIVEGIQNGGANALGLHTKEGDNPGTKPWTQFLQTMESGGYADRDVSEFSITSSCHPDKHRNTTTHGPSVNKPQPTTAKPSQTVRSRFRLRRSDGTSSPRSSGKLCVTTTKLLMSVERKSFLIPALLPSYLPRISC